MELNLQLLTVMLSFVSLLCKSIEESGVVWKNGFTVSLSGSSISQLCRHGYHTYRPTRLTCNDESILSYSPDDLVCLEESPPFNLHVQDPGWPYCFDGAHDVMMDNRFALELVCRAGGLPKPSYLWKFNDGPLPDDERIRSCNGILRIYSPTPEDEGEYQCFASNKHGTTVSEKYTLIYIYNSGQDRLLRENVNVSLHRPAVLECGNYYLYKYPLLDIYWTHHSNEDLVTTDDRINLSPTGDLHFANVVEQDEGVYTCWTANQLLGNFRRLSYIKLTINSEGTVGSRIAPTISSMPSGNITGLRMKEFRIKCLARGFPTPEISWFRNNVELPGDNSGVTLASYNQELTFSSLRFEDAGDYECRADNGVGSPATRTVHLTVESEPFFKELPRGLVLAPGQSSQIRCVAGGVPTPTMVWMQNGVEVQDTENSVFEVSGDTVYINSPREGNSTVFQCVLKNKHGQGVANFPVNIHALPATGISVRPISYGCVTRGNSIDIQCATKGTLPIEWYKDGDKLEEDGSHVFISSENLSNLSVTDVTHNDSGIYECRISRNGSMNIATAMIGVYDITTEADLQPTEAGVQNEGVRKTTDRAEGLERDGVAKTTETGEGHEREAAEKETTKGGRDETTTGGADGKGKFTELILQLIGLYITVYLMC